MHKMGGLTLQLETVRGEKGKTSGEKKRLGKKGSRTKRRNVREHGLTGHETDAVRSRLKKVRGVGGVQ